MFKQRGFTLTELVILVVITGILIAIAVPAYQHYIAKQCLLSGDINTSMCVASENWDVDWNKLKEGDKEGKARKT